MALGDSWISPEDFAVSANCSIDFLQSDRCVNFSNRDAVFVRAASAGRFEARQQRRGLRKQVPPLFLDKKLPWQERTFLSQQRPLFVRKAQLVRQRMAAGQFILAQSTLGSMLNWIVANSGHVVGSMNSSSESRTLQCSSLFLRELFINSCSL